MCIYSVRNPMRLKPIGAMHATRPGARKAALRAAKRLGHATVCHWRSGPVETVFADGTVVPRRLA